MINNTNLFQNIKFSIIKWVDESQDYFNSNDVQVSVLRDEEDGLVINFDNNTAMAEIVVEKPNYAPYRFVSFQIAAIKKNRADIIYSFYDNDQNSVNEIIQELKKGMNYFINLKSK